MEDSFLHEKNPWIDDDLTNGCFRNIFLLAEKTGHLKTGNTKASQLPSNKEPSPSSVMISLLKEITNTRREINKINVEIQCIVQDKETKDLLHLDVLERHVSELHDINSHVQLLSAEKDRLINTLQQPHVGDHVKIHANYKRYACELLPLLAPLLSSLSKELDTLDWAAHTQLDHAKLDELVREVTRTLATLQSSFFSLCSMSGGVRQLHSLRLDQSAAQLIS